MISNSSDNVIALNIPSIKSKSKKSDPLDAGEFRVQADFPFLSLLADDRLSVDSGSLAGQITLEVTDDTIEGLFSNPKNYLGIEQFIDTLQLTLYTRTTDDKTFKKEATVVYFNFRMKARKDEHNKITLDFSMPATIDKKVPGGFYNSFAEGQAKLPFYFTIYDGKKTQDNAPFQSFKEDGVKK